MNTARIRYDTVQIIDKKIILKIDANNLSSEKYKSHLFSTSFFLCFLLWYEFIPRVSLFGTGTSYDLICLHNQKQC